MEQPSTWRKPFFLLYAGQAFSLLSSGAVQFSIIWWITMETGSALALTLASVAGLLPQAVVGLFAGVWIDRFSRKRILVLADMAVAASSLLLCLLYVTGRESLMSVYLVLFIRALGETFHKPALQAAIPQLVPSSGLTKAGGFGQMVSSAASMAGPMLGALLMSVTTLPYAMLIDVLGAVLAVTTLSFVRIPEHRRPPGRTPGFLQDIRQGIIVFRSNRALLRLSVPMLAATIIFVPLGTLLPLMVRGYFNGTAWHNGLVQALFSTGMLLAALMTGITGGLRRPFLMVSMSIGLLGACALIGGFLPADAFFVFCILVSVMGASGMGISIPFMAYIQRTIPPEHLGKVFSLVAAIMSFAAPVGMFLAGPLADRIGIDSWMSYSGILMVCLGFLCHRLTREFDMPGKDEVAPAGN